MTGEQRDWIEANLGPGMGGDDWKAAARAAAARGRWDDASTARLIAFVERGIPARGPVGRPSSSQVTGG